MALINQDKKPKVPYVHQEFPKWKHHQKHGSKLVENAEDEKGLGKGWVNHPSEFKIKESKEEKGE